MNRTPLFSHLLLTTAMLALSPRAAGAQVVPHVVPEKYLGTLKKGLEYLTRNQHKDGHWEGDDGKHPMATTALVGVALLVDGGYDGPHSASIGNALEWVLEKSQARRGGLIYSGHPSETARYMLGHGLAMTFLGSIQWELSQKTIGGDKRIAAALRSAVEYTAKARSSRGGWYYFLEDRGARF